MKNRCFFMNTSSASHPAKINYEKYRVTRILYVIEAMLEYFITILTSGAYLAKLTTSIGISDSMTAILSTLGSMAAAFQVLSVYLSHKTPVKKWVIPLQATNQLMLSMLYLIPFLSVDKRYMGIMFFIIIFCAHSLRNIFIPAKTAWFIRLVNPKSRGFFTAILQSVSLIGGMIFTLLTSIIIDKYEKAGNLKAAFFTLTVVILSLTVLHCITLIFSKEKSRKRKEVEIKLKEELKIVINNKKFRKLLVVNILWAVINSIATPFYNTYQINELGFSMTFISTINIGFTIFNMVVISFIGKISLRTPLVDLLRFGYPIAIISFVIMGFCTPQNGTYTFIIFNVFNIVASSAITVGGTAIYQITPTKYHTAAIALNTIFVGIVSFAVTLIVAPLFDYLKDTLGGKLFGKTFYAQQTLSVISAVIGVMLLIYVYTFFTSAMRSNTDEAEEDDDDEDDDDEKSTESNGTEKSKV